VRSSQLQILIWCEIEAYSSSANADPIVEIAQAGADGLPFGSPTIVDEPARFS